MKYLTYLILMLTIASCVPVAQSNKSIPTTDQTSINEILAVMKMQEDAWSNGNIDQFMQGYWESDSRVFIGSSGITKGWKTTLSNYKRAYPDQKVMGQLKFDILRLQRIDNDNYHMIGKYTLIREDSEPSGYFTLLWRKIDGKWKIVADQTCG